MSVLGIVLSTVVATVAIITAIVMYMKAYKQGGIRGALSKIEPLAIETLVWLVEIRKRDKLGFEALQDYAVNYILMKVKDSGVLGEKELVLLTPDLIKSIIGPKLRELYDANKE